VPIDYLVLPIAGSPNIYLFRQSKPHFQRAKKTKQRREKEGREEGRKRKEKKERKQKDVFLIWPLIDIPANSSG